MGQIAKRDEDKRLLKLLGFLNAGVMENGLVSPSAEESGGGPLSPLLKNPALDEPTGSWSAADIVRRYADDWHRRSQRTRRSAGDG